MPDPTGRPLLFRRWAAMAFVWLPAVAVLLPVLVVLVRAGQPAGEFWGHIVEYRLSGYVRQTLILVVSVTALAIVFGVPAAWFVSVYQFPGRKAFEWLLLLPLAMPGFVAAVAYIDTLQGLIPVYVWIRNHHGIDAFLLSQVVAPWIFAVGVLAATLFPYVFLSCRAVFSRQARGALEAARLLGAGGFRSFCQIALPMARPAVVAGGSLVAMETINDFGVVTYFGLSPLTPGIFRAWTEGHAAAAMRMAVMLMAIILIGLSLERWHRGRRRFAADASEGMLARKPLGFPAVVLAWTACGLPLLLGFAIPAWRMGRWAVQSWDGTDWSGNLGAAANSFGLAAGSAALIVAGAVLLVAGHRALKSGVVQVAQRVGLLGYAFPSALVAVGIGALVVSLAVLPGAGALALSSSVFGLMLAYFVRFLAVGIQPIAAGFDRVSSSLHEAARTLGARPLRALFQVDLPLVWPALLAGATLAFIDVFKELPLTLILRPFDFETLATRTFRLTDEGRIPEASVPGLAMVLLSLIGLIPLTRMLRLVSR